MTTILLIITITAIISFLAWRNPSLLDRWIMNPYQIHNRGEYHRLLTSGFVHADAGHLIFNMLSLYFFGGLIEQIFGALFGGLGPVYLIGFYLAGILVSDIPSYLKHRYDPGYNSLGASGGVSAIIFASILVSPLSKIYMYFIPIGIPGFIFGALYLAYTYYSSKQSRDNINHDAHLYGAIFGIVFMIAVYPEALPLFIQQIASWQPF